MNLKQIEVFLAVLEHGGFAAAARATKQTQSTISQHVTALETELGVILLERSRNGVTLTEGGAILRKHARNLVAELESADAAIRRFKGEHQTTLRLGVSTIPAAYLVPPVLARLCEENSHLTLSVQQGDSSAVIEWLTHREIEVGVVGRRSKERGLTFVEVGEDRISLVVPPKHAWAGRSTIPVDGLYDEFLIFRESGSGTGATVLDALRAAGVEPGRLRSRGFIGGNEAIKAAVIAGLGASFLSSFAVSREIQRGELKKVEVKGVSISRPFYLVRRSGPRLTAAAEAFWKRMLESYPSPARAAHARRRP